MARFCSPLGFGALLSLILMLSLPSAGFAGDKDVTVTTYTPSVTLTLEVLTPQGAPRTYPTANGPTFWGAGLPVIKGDHVKLDIFVSTGGGELTQAKVRLDNQLIATLDKSPWSTSLDSNTLGLGYHSVEVWAQESGTKTTSASQTMTFYVANAPETSGVVTAVKGEQQVLSGNAVTEVPLAGKAPALPAALASGSVDPSATVGLSIDDPVAQQALSAGNLITVTSPVVVSVSTPAGSGAHRFAYALTRGDQTIYEADHAVGTNLARIRIQQRSDTQPGLLPGHVMLWVWGVDDNGNYGNPVSATFDIAGAAGAS